MRLTTVRKYAPLPVTEDASPMIAMIYFFLDTTVKMRLDRLDGIGATVWLDDFSVTAAVKGILEGLRTRETKGDGAEGVQAADLLSLLQSFDKSELERIFEPLLDHYVTQDSDGMALMSLHMDDHISVLRQALQDFHCPVS